MCKVSAAAAVKNEKSKQKKGCELNNTKEREKFQFHLLKFMNAHTHVSKITSYEYI